MLRDPVCGMEFDESGQKFAADYNGKKFYFCSANCKSDFDKDPHRYGHRS